MVKTDIKSNGQRQEKYKKVLHADPYRWLLQASLKNLKEGKVSVCYIEFFYNSSFLGTHPLYRATSSTKKYSSPLWQKKTSHKRAMQSERTKLLDENFSNTFELQNKKTMNIFLSIWVAFWALQSIEASWQIYIGISPLNV